MAQFLEERMTRTYTELSERQELERDTALVKSYLVEVHPVDGEDGSRALLERATEDEALHSRFPATVHASDELALVTIDGTFDKREALSLYVDSTDPRYWLIHTMGTSNAADWILSRLIKTGARIDQAWVPAQLLESLSYMGSFRGLGLDFDRRPFESDDDESLDEYLEFLKMQLWGNRARRVLQVLRQRDAFPDATTLAKVKIKFWPDEEDSGSFTLDDIKYDGKITARGTSFDGHVMLVSTLKEAYSREITKLERNFSIGFAGDDRFDGQALGVALGRSIQSLDRFCATVFSSSEPFRLWGAPIRVSSNFVRVRAVDLHVGATIDFEITPDVIRIYLPKGTCGNTVMRFYTNLQHHFDSRVSLLDGEDDDVFEF